MCHCVFWQSMATWNYLVLNRKCIIYKRWVFIWHVCWQEGSCDGVKRMVFNMLWNCESVKGRHRAPTFSVTKLESVNSLKLREKGPITCTGPTGPTGSTGPYGPYGPYEPFTGPIRALRDLWGPSNSPETDFTLNTTGCFSVLKLRHTCWIISLLLPLLA